MSDPLPQTRYARTGEVHIAYQVIGRGPVDLIMIPGWVSHVEFMWEIPMIASFMRRISHFCRLIIMDRRGTGLSDPVVALPTLEERADEIRAVMDDAGSARAALFGISEGGPLCALFAAAFPARTESLILYGTFAKGCACPEYPSRPSREQLEEFVDIVEKHWGHGTVSGYISQTVRADPVLTEQWGRLERMSASPGSATRLMKILVDFDVRDVLPSIRCPTLVLARKGDPLTRPQCMKDMAGMIPHAIYRELEGDDHLPYAGEQESLLEEVQHFITGTREAHEADRVLATVMFLDIVGSTEHAARLGDAAWRELLERFLERATRNVNRHRGVLIKSTGDGFLARFDGPARAVRCALEMRDAARPLDLEIRSGLHTGECEVMPKDVGGMAVHIASRICDLAEPSEVLVSRTIKDLVVGSGLRFSDRGTHTLKGVEEPWQLFRVEG